MGSNWKNLLVKPESTIEDSLRCINLEALQMVFIVDNIGNLLGIATEGDIRRGMLGGLSLSSPIKSVLNEKPIVATPSTANGVLIKLMKQKKLFAIPVVEGGKLVEVKTLDTLTSYSIKDNPVFLMAGGFGTRLHPLTNNCPKPLLHVGDRPILEKTFLQFIEHGFHNFYISTHYLPDMIRDHFGNGEDWGVNITYVHEETPLGTGGALGLLPEDIPNLPLIMMNGDILTTLDFSALLDSFSYTDAVATMCLREFEYQIPYGVVETRDSCVIEMQEKPVHCYNVNAGIYIVSPQVVQDVPVGTHVDMPTLLEQQIAKGNKVATHIIREYWLDIGRMEDFQKAQKDVAQL